MREELIVLFAVATVFIVSTFLAAAWLFLFNQFGIFINRLVGKD